jgi:predicted HTH domain antitoxin
VDSSLVVIEMPKQIESRLTPEAAALNMAVGLFVSNEVTLGQGAEIAKISQSDFMRELGSRKIPMHYDEEDLAEDMETIRTVLKK